MQAPDWTTQIVKRLIKPWANYVAFDEDLIAYQYRDQPTKDDFGWGISQVAGDLLPIDEQLPHCDWQDSLRIVARRPSGCISFIQFQES